MKAKSKRNLSTEKHNKCNKNALESVKSRTDQAGENVSKLEDRFFENTVSG